MKALPFKIMTNERIEARLQSEIERARSTGLDVRIPVTIQLTPAGEGIGESRNLIEMERQVAGRQGGIIARLTELGVQDIESSVLSNSISARLTTQQIQEIAQHPDVKLVVWNREDFVAF